MIHRADARRDSITNIAEVINAQTRSHGNFVKTCVLILEISAGNAALQTFLQPVINSVILLVIHLDKHTRLGWGQLVVTLNPRVTLKYIGILHTGDPVMAERDWKFERGLERGAGFFVMRSAHNTLRLELPLKSTRIQLLIAQISQEVRPSGTHLDTRVIPDTPRVAHLHRVETPAPHQIGTLFRQRVSHAEMIAERGAHVLHIK